MSKTINQIFGIGSILEFKSGKWICVSIKHNSVYCKPIKKRGKKRERMFSFKEIEEYYKKHKS